MNMRLILILIQACLVLAWNDEDFKPRNTLILGEHDIIRFRGNSTHKDFFKLLERDGEHLLVGARNVVYNLSLPDLTERNRIDWYSTATHKHLCLLKGKTDDVCQNFIRILTKKRNNKVLICGTNAFKPLCRDYSLRPDGSYRPERERSGQGVCPYHPHHNSTYAHAGGTLYVGTVADFSGTDPLIYRDPLRTEQFDLKQLNAPSFVSSIEYHDQVFFFFRETAVEYINCGKTVYSRVGRVCKGDKGGPHKFRFKWTSFLKSRLNCSISGEFPFYFSEIQSTSKIVPGPNGEDVIYAVFTTSQNSIPGSAICAFRIMDILATFQGAYKEQPSMNSNWLPVRGDRVPEPRPGSCVNDSRTLMDQTLSFLKSHSLMDEAVPAFTETPIVVTASLRHRLTTVVVDSEATSPLLAGFNVVFVGTDAGRILKVSVRKSRSGKVISEVLEDLQVLPAYAIINNMMIVSSSGWQQDPRLLVVSDEEVASISLQRCSLHAKTCSECVALQDPYCFWNRETKVCETAAPPLYEVKTKYIQHVEDGYTSTCPKDPAVAVTPAHEHTQVSEPCDCMITTPEYSSVTSVFDVENVPVSSLLNLEPDEGEGDAILSFQEELTTKALTDDATWTFAWEHPRVYTAETLIISVTSAGIGALFIGFLAGFIFARQCRSEDTSCRHNRYLDHRLPITRKKYESKLVNHTDYQCCIHTSNNKSLNLLLNVPDKKDNNLAANVDNYSKVKKYYL